MCSVKTRLCILIYVPVIAGVARCRTVFLNKLFACLYVETFCLMSQSVSNYGS